MSVKCRTLGNLLDFPNTNGIGYEMKIFLISFIVVVFAIWVGFVAIPVLTAI